MEMVGMEPGYDPAAAGMIDGGFGGMPGRGGAAGRGAEEDKDKVEPTLEVRKFSFTFQFLWQEKPRSLRLEEKRAREAAEAAEAEAAEGEPSGDTMAMQTAG